MPPKAWPERLGTKLADGQLGLIFVGMSNVGKSYQTKKLTKQWDGHVPFGRICVDDGIEQALARQMKADGIDGDGIDAVARWMGSPHASDPAIRQRYGEREQTYLALENGIYEQLIEQTHDRPWTIDTTGSFVHCSLDTQRALAARGVVVYIEATQTDMDDMLASYLSHPKPVCWAGQFQLMPGETMATAVETSYRRLLSARDLSYRSLADVTVAKRAVQATATPVELLQVIDAQMG